MSRDDDLLAGTGVDICDYCGKPPPILDADGLRLEPFTGWACIVCGAEIGPFDE